MSHVDDGRLATYLDEGESGTGQQGAAEIQAHLAACAECRARLEVMRSERGKARAILRAGGLPTGRVPSFADVLERSKARSAQAADRRKLSRLTSLAWAATVVVAVAVGWYARQASFRASPVLVAPETQPAKQTPVIEAAPPAAMPTTPPQVARQRATRRDAPSVIAVAPQATPASRTDVAAKGEVATPNPDLTDAPNKPTASSSGAGAAPARAGAFSPLLKASSIVSWKDVTPDAASEALGTRPLLLAGAPVTSYALSASGDQVRITQQMGDGTVIELVEGHPRVEAHLEPAAANSSRGADARAPRPAMAPATRETDALTQPAEPPDAVSAIRDGYVVTLRVIVTPRGALTRDSLAVLLTKVR